jgi:hypothetical protein
MNQPAKKSFKNRLELRWTGMQNQRRIQRLTNKIPARAQKNLVQKPVVFFNASARLSGISQNAAFSLLSSWSFRLTGVPVVHFVCRSGMSHCVQGTHRDDYTKPPPCAACISQSRQLYQDADVTWFDFQRDHALTSQLHQLSVPELSSFNYTLELVAQTDQEKSALSSSRVTVPFGKIVLPSMRWALRCHDLPDDESIRYLFREYIHSAYNLATSFDRFLSKTQPSAAMIFNGVMYPEATACWVARARGVRVITHEVGFVPFSAFFSEGEATAYPIHIPREFKLTEGQDAQLNEHLEKRFQGKFSMAGIQFWPQIKALDEKFLQHANRFRQIVPIFTNVIYDTSQIHANTIFPHMFEWLETVKEIIQKNLDTLFIIRAHPDEMRPGTRKQSRQSVHDWVLKNQIAEQPNVIFVDSQEYISSYELIQKAKFLMVYNSSIGLESALMGIPVLCAGKARYTQYPTVFLPTSIEEFVQLAEKFLFEERIELPGEFQQNARRFLYYQLFRASLPFGNFMQSSPRPGYIQLQKFTWEKLLAENSAALRVIHEGFFDHKDFLIDE